MILNILPVSGNLDDAERFYHELLGLQSDIGDPRARHAFEFKGVGRKPLRPGVADPDSVLVILVHDLDNLMTRVQPAGGQPTGSDATLDTSLRQQVLIGVESFIKL